MNRLSSTAPTTVGEWIAWDARPLALIDPDQLDHDIDAFMSALSPEVQLLGFGEPLHGGEGFLQLRNRLFQRLATHHGFTAIALESSYPKGLTLNAFVNGDETRGQTVTQVAAACAAGASHGFGSLEANRELIGWMRGHNLAKAKPRGLQVHGFDGPMEMWSTDSPRRCLQVALDYLDRIEVGSSERRSRIETLLGPDAPWENPAAMMDPAQAYGGSPAASALRLEVEDLLLEFGSQRPEWSRHSGREAFEEAWQHARVARALLGYHATLAHDAPDRTQRLLGQRDALMADILVDIARREPGRVLVFAHNRHLQLGPATWQLGPTLLKWWPAGAHLREEFGSTYRVVGSALFDSPENGIGEPEPGSLEAWFGQRPEAAFLLATQGGRELPQAVIQALPTRSGSTRNSTYMPLNADSITDFDWLAFLRTTVYSRGGPALP